MVSFSMMVHGYLLQVKHTNLCKMAVFKGFTVALKEFFHRCMADENKRFIDEHKQKLNFAHASSCISIGPGFGDLDVHAIRTTMPNLKHYTAVERDPDLLRSARQQIEKLTTHELPNMQTQYCLEDAEDWEGPSGRVDVILLFYVLSYFKDPELFLKRCMSWLLPGGYVWIMHSLNTKLYENLKRHFKLRERSGISPALGNDMVYRLGFSGIQECSFREELDLSEANKDLVSFLLHRDATSLELEAFKTMAHEEFGQAGDISETQRRVLLLKK